MAFTKDSLSNYRMINGQLSATYVRIRCDRGSQRPSVATGVRRSSTRLIGCPFRVRASCTKRLNDKWVYAVVNGRHNHGLSLDPVAHPVHRRRTAAQREAIRQISAIQGVPAGAVADLLRIQYPEALVTAKDIDNERQLARREALAQGTGS
ncbi:hypothetical protein E4U13_005828 [Claviceps humidiphila]|uniref:FAR1 domain-containing protein n=1 Tax=Claviceps humidiphila TaxID=1294629 RepID=A0A9P7PZT9_9HYPO|nr:hypothetical protein E4U13_005828 [Claviceps humidiphila]